MLHKPNGLIIAVVVVNNGVYRNIMYQIEKRKLQQSYFGNYRCEIVSRINYNFYVKYLCLLPSWKRMKDLPLSLRTYLW